MQIRPRFLAIAAVLRRIPHTAMPGAHALGALLLGAVAGCARAPSVPLSDADAARGKEAVRRYGCGACHAIPGFANQGSNVGPPLDGIARRGYIGGVLPNTPLQMVRWLRNPPQADPRTAMPAMGISEADAKDIAAYLYTLD